MKTDTKDPGIEWSARDKSRSPDYWPDFFITIDGETRQEVQQFKTGPDGYVLRYCTDGHLGTPGEKHITPEGDEVCMAPIERGHVVLHYPDGMPVEDEAEARGAAKARMRERR